MLIRRELGAASIGFTDRWGGESVVPFDTLNVARHIDDDPLAVAANQRLVADMLGRPEAPWVMPRHVHGTTVLAVSDSTRDGEEADGVATQRSGLLLAAVGADCAPIAIANDTACAAIHAGWRGTVHGVIAAGVAMVRALGTGPVRAVVGPCVCAHHYEFGADLLDQLVEEHGPELGGHTVTGAPAFDLRGAIRAQFRRVDVEHVEVIDICTVESTDHFSYRRDGLTGRQAVVVVKR